jgi:tetratricopeptide (TPR) repeat protein
VTLFGNPPFLGPDNIPFELFVEGRSHLPVSMSNRLEGASNNPLVFNEMLAPLVKYSLVDVDSKNTSFIMHRLVQEVIVSGMSKPARMRLAQKAVKVVASACPHVDDAESRIWDRLYSHMIISTRYISEYQLNDDDLYINIYYYLGLIFSRRGELVEAENAYEQALYISADKDGLISRSTAHLSASLGWASYVIGDYKKAERSYRFSITVFENNEGLSSINVARSVDGLAGVYRALGKLEIAEEMYKRSLCILELHGKKEQHEYAVSYNNLALVVHRLGRRKEAIVKLEFALKLHQQLGGPESISVARDLLNLANMYRDGGEDQKALDLLFQSRKIYAGYYGEEHFETAACLCSIGAIYCKMDRLDEGKRLIEQCLPIMETNVGPFAPIVITAYSSLGHVALQEERINDAIELFKKTVLLSSKVFGGNPILTHQHIDAYLTSLYAGEKYDDALQFAITFVNECRKCYGINNQTYVYSLGYMQKALFLKKMYKQAIQVCEDSIKIIESTECANWPSLINILYNYE